jgi:hypothetical protein
MDLLKCWNDIRQVKLHSLIGEAKTSIASVARSRPWRIDILILAMSL